MTKARRLVAIATWTLSGALLLGCGSDPPPPCMAGYSAMCTCPDGTPSLAICSASGVMGACECGGTSCVSGQTMPCVCPDGTQSTQACSSGYFGNCLCAAGNQPPIANAGSAQQISVNKSATLDGTSSYDPDGNALKYTWELTAKPTGSAATLSDPSSAQPTFVADREGTYTFRLVVSDGIVSSAPSTVTVTAVNDPPVANAGPNVNVETGSLATLDGSGSSDPNGSPITFQWTITSAPPGSSAVLGNATSATPSFTPDVDGSYQIKLTVSDGSLSTSVTVTVASYRHIAMLSFRVIDAEYSSALDAIIMVGASPSALYVYHADTDAVQTVALPTAPTAVSVSPDGLSAAVGHNAYLSLVNLSTATVSKTVAVSADVLDVVLAGNGYAYAFPRVDQWEYIRCINLSTGAETLSTGNQIYAGTLAKLASDGVSIYGADNGLSPDNLEKYDISGGTAKYAYPSPYWGDYPMCGNLWMSGDGQRIFTRCGNVFRSSSVQTEDMVYNGALSNVSHIQHLDHSVGAGKVLAIPGVQTYTGSPTADTDLQIYDYAYLGYLQTTHLPSFITPTGVFDGHGRFVFANKAATNYYVVLQADSTSGLLNDYGVVTYAF